MRNVTNIMPAWVTNEAISNYITFIVGIIIGIIAWLLKTRFERKKPSLIRVEKLSQESLVDIAPKIRGKLSIIYQDQPITELHHTVLQISNIGEDPLKDVKIRFVISGLEDQDFLEISADRLPQDVTFSGMNTGNGKQRPFEITLGFINPKQDYGEAFQVEIYSPKLIHFENVSGRGFGWNVKYYDKLAYQETIMNFLTDQTILASVTRGIVENLVGFRLKG